MGANVTRRFNYSNDINYICKALFFVVILVVSRRETVGLIMSVQKKDQSRTPEMPQHPEHLRFSILCGGQVMK